MHAYKKCVRIHCSVFTEKWGQIYNKERLKSNTECEIEMLMVSDSSNWPFAKAVGWFAEATFVPPTSQPKKRRRVLCVVMKSLIRIKQRGWVPTTGGYKLREKADKNQTLFWVIAVFVMQCPLLHSCLTHTTNCLYVHKLMVLCPFTLICPKRS